MKHVDCPQNQVCSATVLNMEPPLCDSAECVMQDLRSAVNAYRKTLEKFGDNVRQDGEGE